MKNIYFRPAAKWCDKMLSPDRHKMKPEPATMLLTSACSPSCIFILFAISFLLILSPCFAQAALVSDQQGRLHSSTMPVRVAQVPPAPESATQAGNISSVTVRRHPASTLPSYKNKQTTTQKSSLPNAGLQGFCPNPFGLERDELGQRTHEAKKLRAKVTRVQKNATAVPPQEDKQVSVTSKIDSPSDDRLIPHRAAFSGGVHTLPHMENEANPEVSMSYKMTPNAATRFVVNPQDPASPLYRPAEKNGKINGGGVYMDVNLREDLQLQMGGEYNDIDNQYASGSDSGASLGLRWNF